MITLESFYDLISRNAQVTLLNTRCRTNIFTGSARNIPDEYSACPVEDFSMNDSGHLTFKIKVKETRPAGSNWQEGTIRVHDRIYHYWVKQYPESSKYGIGGGRVSKLMLKRPSWRRTSSSTSTRCKEGLTMFGIRRETVERLRREYPVGCRVELVQMDDVQAPPIGTKGTVRGVDDIGSIMVRWDNGCGLSVAYGDDMCRRIDE